jgi:DNA-binding CsgD family transcriptional regulator/tetratricopeptide (TPR) repeat protein
VALPPPNQCHRQPVSKHSPECGVENSAPADGPRGTVHWLDVARNLVLQNPDAGSWEDVLVAVGKTLARLGHVDLSRALFHDVATLGYPAVPSTALPVHVEATRWQAQLDVTIGRHREACSALITALAKIPDQQSADAATLKVTLASVGLQCGARDPTWALEAVDAAALHEAALQAHALAVFAVGASMGGDLDRATRASARAAELLNTRVSDESVADRMQSSVWLGFGAAMVERYRDAVGHFTHALPLVRMSKDDLWAVHALVGLSAAHCCLGRLAEAATHAAVAVEQATTLKYGALQELAYAAQARSALLAGDHETALRAASKARQVATPARPLTWNDPRVLVAEVELLEGRPRQCVDLLVEIGEGPRLSAAPAVIRPEIYELLVRASLTEGSTQEAMLWAEQAGMAVENSGLIGGIGFAHLAYAQALLPGKPATAAITAQAAADALRRVGRRVERARACVVAGRALTAAGQDEQANLEFERAASLFDICGAHRARDEVLTHCARVTPGASTVKPARGFGLLSRREIQVVELVIQGRTNREIARALSLSPRTVETYLARIFSKLDASSRAEVAGKIAPLMRRWPVDTARSIDLTTRRDL